MNIEIVNNPADSTVSEAELAERRKIIGEILQAMEAGSVGNDRQRPDGDMVLALLCSSMPALRRVAAMCGIH